MDDLDKLTKSKSVQKPSDDPLATIKVDSLTQLADGLTGFKQDNKNG